MSEQYIEKAPSFQKGFPQEKTYTTIVFSKKFPMLLSPYTHLASDSLRNCAFYVCTGMCMVSGLAGCATRNPSPPVQHIQVPKTDSIQTDKHAEVERTLREAVQEAERLGPSNPFLLSSLYSLAAYYRDHQEFSKAEMVYQRALALKENSTGPEHPDVALILENYARLLKTANRQAEALPLESRARAIRAHYPSPSQYP